MAENRQCEVINRKPYQFIVPIFTVKNALTRMRVSYMLCPCLKTNHGVISQATVKKIMSMASKASGIRKFNTRIARYIWALVERNGRLFATLAPILYAKCYFFSRTGRFPNSKHPIDFNDELFMIRMRHGIREARGADKFAVREIVRQAGAEHLLPKNYGVFDSVEELDLSALPDECVLKCTHGCGFNIFKRVEDHLDPGTVKMHLRNWLAEKYGLQSAEYHYLKIKPRILIEELVGSGSSELVEIQAFCFSGRVEFLLARNDIGLATSHPSRFAQSFDREWNRLSLRIDEENCPTVFARPAQLEEIISVSEKLSADFRHVRVDFLICGKRLSFGEMTFTTSGGIFSNYRNEVVRSMGSGLDWTNTYKFAS